MKKIISINCGSSSLKFQLYNMPSEEVLTSGIAERIGLDNSIFTIKVNDQKHVLNVDLQTHEVAVKLLLESLIKYNIVKDLDEIIGVGHRVVQGGTTYNKSVLVDNTVVKAVEDNSELAPLHNPANLVGYFALKEALPNVKHAFVFDTAFHQTIKESSYIYPIPYQWYSEYKVRRYGAHGTSHLYVSQRAIDLLDLKDKPSKIITCHLGNGASITAVKDGESINTSMGFTPLGGIMMGTRSGDLDPAIVSFMAKKLNKSAQDIIDLLNKNSGMLGVSGVSSDARDIQQLVDENNPRGILTQEIYVNRVINVIGGYVFQMGGVDAIVFTAGLGENDIYLRGKILNAMQEALGLSIDDDLNNTRGQELKISKDDSKVNVYVIPTDEELIIARDTYNLIN